MAHLVHFSKRRRLNDATSTLSKPFKSPLRTPHQKEHNKTETGSLLQKTKRAQSCNEGQSEAQEARSSVSHADNNNYASTNTAMLPPKDHNISSSPTKSSHSHYLVKLPQDSELQALQRQETTLQSRLSTLRSELDTAQQALRIESSTRDQELSALTSKWRSVSQDAADELFTSALEKIVKIGGVKVWREREHQRREQLRTWYDDDGPIEGKGGSQGIEEYDAEEDSLEMSSKQVKEDQDDDEAFTMDMMLMTLNIELDIIGFDKNNQTWTKL